MSEEPEKDLKTTAEGVASAAPGAAEAKAPASSGDEAQEAEKVAGKDEGKKKDEDKNQKEEAKKNKKEEEQKKDKNKDKDKDEKKDKNSGEKKAPGLPFKIPESAILAAALVASLTAGSLLGCLLIAPKVIAARNAQPATPARAEKAEGGGEARAGEGKQGKGEKSAVFSIDNIVVNPAGSAGTRFLMASVAFELPDEKAVVALREKEVQIRDAVITTLESQTLEMLAAPGSREGIKRQLAIAIKPLVPGHQQPRVYLPQFVLQ